MIKANKGERGFVSMIGILIALLIAAFLMYRVSKTYFVSSVGSRPEDRKALAGEGISAGSPVDAIDLAQHKADEANKRTRDFENQVNGSEQAEK